MASSFGSKSHLERRIRQLRKESELVREDIRSLNRALRNRDELERLPRLKSGRYMETPIPAPTRRDPVRTREPEAPAMPPRMTEPSAAETPPLPAHTTPLGGELRAGAPPVAMPAVGAPKSRPHVKDERFANLFSSGGFLGSVNARQERNVQKNKAIFMLLVVLVVFFIVYRLVF